MCAQFNPFTLFLPGQPTPTGPGKRVKFVKGLIPAHAQKRSGISAWETSIGKGVWERASILVHRVEMMYE